MMSTQQNRPVFMYILGIVIIAGVALFALFTAADRAFLDRYSLDATVEKKEYVPPGVTTSTQLVGGRTQAVPVATDERYVLHLVNGKTRVAACVNKARYTATSEGDTVNITCRRRRISGKVDIVSVN